MELPRTVFLFLMPACVAPAGFFISVYSAVVFRTQGFFVGRRSFMSAGLIAGLEVYGCPWIFVSDKK